MLIKRILTALILVPLLLLAIFYLPIQGFVLLTGILCLQAAWEWTSLMKIDDVKLKLMYIILIALLGFGSLLISDIDIFTLAFCWWLMAFILILSYPKHLQPLYGNRLMQAFMGVMVIIPTFDALKFIRHMGIDTLLFLFILIWLADSAAYFVGRKWGTKRLAPIVSPGKSWQGFYAALITGLLFTVATLWYQQVPKHIWWAVIVVALCTVLFSIVGDLFESLIKRQAGVKDSGSLLPGHGGLLDRIDSLTAAAPIFALGMILVGLL
jgi:phosphatidate cytidylyltransferase